MNTRQPRRAEKRMDLLDEPLLTIADVAARLNVAETWVRDKVTQRAVVHRRLGKHVRFTEADYVALLELARVTPEGGPDAA